MRKLVLCLLLLLTCSLKSQTVVVDGRSWEYGVDYGDHIPHYFRFTIKGEAIFDEKQCGKLYYSDEKSEFHIGYIYESKDNRISVYNTFQDLECAYFLHKGWLVTNDFSLNIGDTVSAQRYRYSLFVDNNKYLVYDMDAVIVDSVKRGRWSVKIAEYQKPSKPYFVVVEGIGNDVSGIFAYNNLFRFIDGYPQYAFLACYDGERCIFKRNDFYIEPAVNGIDEVNKELFLGYLFDLQGRKVKNPTKGLYIKDGKKVVVK